MPSALSSSRAVPYDAYNQEHLHDQPAASHPPHPHQHPQQAGAGGSPSVRQPWYDMSDGAVTPPDDSSSSSHRGDFVSHVAAGLPHAVTTIRHRPVGCRLVVSFCTDLLLLASLAVCAYFLRLTDLPPVIQVKFNCFDISLRHQQLPVNSSTVSLFPMFGHLPHNTAHVACFCLPPTLMALTELLLWSLGRRTWQTSLSVGRQCRLSLSFRRLLRFTGTFVLGFLLMLIVVDVSKLLCGRLRPTFIEACRPDWSLCDADASKLQQSSTDACQQTDPHVLVGVQKSFPSMHAAMSAYSAFYVAIYLHNVVSVGHKAYILRPFLSLTFVFSSAFYSIYRLSLNVSHWTDVAAGFAIGVLLAAYLGIFVLHGFHERLSPGRLYWRLERALSLLDFGSDVDEFGGGGRPSAAGSSSSASHAGGGGDWRCTDSTSARSWHHFIASAAAHMSAPPSALPHPVLVNAHHHHQQQQQQKFSD